MEIRFLKSPPERISADLFFLAVFQNEGEKEEKTPARLRSGDGGTALDKLLGGTLSAAIREQVFAGEEGSTLTVNTLGKLPAKNIVVVGAGPMGRFRLETLRRIGHAVAQTANRLKAKSAAGVVEPVRLKGLPNNRRFQAFLEGALISRYQFEAFKKKRKGEPHSLQSLTFQFSGNPRPLQDGARTAEAIIGGVERARHLVNTPANFLAPKDLGKAAAELAKKYPAIRCEVFNLERIRKERMHALIAVGQGSENPPVFIHLKYTPPKKAKTRVALVGKGITFDSGGLNIKTREMELMKIDMAGAAAVLGFFEILGRLRPAVAVEGFIASAENMPSGSAYRPSDIIDTRGGKTVEILNTDAEGRLVLADALDYACDRKPAFLIEMSTLTGGSAYAVGELMTPVMGNDKKLIAKLIAAAEQAGEPAWELPLYEDYKKGYAANTPADMKNSGTGYKCSCINGGLFLSEFVRDTAFVHMDIASTAWAEKPLHYHTMIGATGTPVRTLAYFLLDL